MRKWDLDGVPDPEASDLGEFIYKVGGSFCKLQLRIVCLKDDTFVSPFVYFVSARPIVGSVMARTSYHFQVLWCCSVEWRASHKMQ
jgi:hypothetical protein